MTRVCEQHRPEYHESEAYSYFQTDPYVCTTSYLAFLEGLDAKTEASKRYAELALETAQTLNHSHTLAHTYFFDALISFENRDMPRFGQRVQELAQTAALYDFDLWLVLAGVFEALGQQDALQYMERLALLEKTGTKLGETWFVGHLYELLKAAGQTGPAQAALEQCRAIAQERGERFFLNKLEAEQRV